MTAKRIYLVVRKERACLDYWCNVMDEIPCYAFPSEQMAEQCATMLNEDEERKRRENREYNPRTFDVSDARWDGIPMFDRVPDMEELEQEGARRS